MCRFDIARRNEKNSSHLTQERAGSDVIELGVPFSDPLADGGTIQKANTDALNNGVTLKDCLNYVKDARSKDSTLPWC